MKQTTKNRQKRRLGLVIVIIAVMAFTGIVILFMNHDRGRLTDDTTSSQNQARMRKAVHDRDVRVCDQISGAINYTNPNTEKSKSGFSSGVSVVTPAMTETQAKEKCRNHVQQLIDQQNYEDKVCVDKRLTHYNFNEVRWPCPEMQDN